MGTPETWSRMPLSAPAWVSILYALFVPAIGIGFAGFEGLLVAILVAGFSFQFWTVAAFRGMRRQTTTTTKES